MKKLNLHIDFTLLLSMERGHYVSFYENTNSLQNVNMQIKATHGELHPDTADKPLSFYEGKLNDVLDQSNAQT